MPWLRQVGRRPRTGRPPRRAPASRPAKRDSPSATNCQRSSAVGAGDEAGGGDGAGVDHRVHRPVDVELDGHHRVEREAGAVDAELLADRLGPSASQTSANTNGLDTLWIENRWPASPTSTTSPVTLAMHAPNRSGTAVGQRRDVVGERAVGHQAVPFVGLGEGLADLLGPRQLSRRDQPRHRPHPSPRPDLTAAEPADLRCRGGARRRRGPSPRGRSLVRFLVLLGGALILSGEAVDVVQDKLELVASAGGRRAHRRHRPAHRAAHPDRAVHRRPHRAGIGGVEPAPARPGEPGLRAGRSGRAGRDRADRGPRGARRHPATHPHRSGRSRRTLGLGVLSAGFALAPAADDGRVRRRVRPGPRRGPGAARATRRCSSRCSRCWCPSAWRRRCSTSRSATRATTPSAA